jgi:predicted amidohydrolase
MISRRRFGGLIGGGAALAGIAPKHVAYAASPAIRVAAVQMTAELANVEANLLKAERLVRLAFSRGARWVVLPEFFTSAMAFHPAVANAIREVDGAPAELLRKLAREGKGFVGGSFLAWRDGNVYNTFVLALPDGRTLRHDKDYPSFWENCYYVNGSDDGVLPTPDGNVGVAVCYEFVRSKTAARLKGKVGMVIGGSCWWGLEDSAPADHPDRRWLLDLLRTTPGRFARFLGVPVVHASHAGHFQGRSWPGEPTAYSSSYLGETQIVNGRGEILARMSREDGEGVITADVIPGEPVGEAVPIPDRFWIPDLPAGEIRAWQEQLKSGHEFYLANTLPAMKRRFGVPPHPTRRG